MLKEFIIIIFSHKKIEKAFITREWYPHWS